MAKEIQLIYKRPESPNWYYRFWVLGEEFKGSTGQSNQRLALMEALRIQEEATAEVERRTAGTSESTLEALCEDWWRAVGKKQGDAENTRSILDKLLGKMEKRVKTPDGKYVRTKDGGFVTEKLPGLSPDRLVHQLTQSEVAKLYDTRLTEGNSVATANREIARLQAVVRWGRTRGIRVFDWWADMKSVKQKEPKGKVRYIGPEDEAKLLAELDPKGDPRKADQYHLILCALHLGCRYNEIASLQWEDIDFEAGTVLIWRPKTKNKDTLVMTDTLFNALADRFNNRNVANPYVFPGRFGEGHRSYSTKGIRKALERAGVNDAHKVERYGKASVHTCRDTFATKIVKAGASLYDVQMILGHASPQMSQKYAHAKASDASKKAAALINKLDKEST